MGESTASLRIAVGAAGLCWFLFAALASYFNRRNLRAYDEQYYRFSIVEGWRGLFHIIRDARKLDQNFKFLCAWFILSDESRPRPA
jgi:MFS-type transporter involved in bile tolerance (Atg22 family)